MSRPTRLMVLGCGLAMIAMNSGCRSFRGQQVPPERPYVMDSASSIEMTPPPVGFSSEPATRPFPGASETSMPTPGLGNPGADPLPGMPGLAPSAGTGSGFDPAVMTPPGGFTPN